MAGIDGIIDGAKELLGYNRENFFFDSELQLKREYQEQDMRVKQFVLYREDVRDLTELTTGKMDCYLLVALLEIGCCFDLLVHGVLRFSTEGQNSLVSMWQYTITWIYVISLAEAFLYLFLSCWFAIHASVAAHSFAVRLLTQYVRLPVPDKKQLDAARAYAAEFEKAGIDSVFRLPVFSKQLQNMVDSYQDADDADDCDADGMDLVRMVESNPVGAMKHVQMYRALQSNWQAHDAYARACLSLGTYAMVHAIAYYCIGFLVFELHAPVPALATAILLTVAAWILIRLDIFFTNCLSFLMSLVLVCVPLLGHIGSTMAILQPDVQHHVICILKALSPVIFFLHIGLIVWIVFVARAERSDGSTVALPKRFHQVLYLDVFAWLKPPSVGDSAANAEGQQAASTPKRQQLPPQLLEKLRAESRDLVAYLEAEFKSWEGKKLAPGLQEMKALKADVQQLRQQFQSVKEELARHDVVLPSPDEIGPIPDLWVKLTLDLGYFVNSSTGEVRKDLAEGANTSDIITLQDHLTAVCERCAMLTVEKQQEETTEEQQASDPSSRSPPGTSSGVVGTTSSARSVQPQLTTTQSGTSNPGNRVNTLELPPNRRAGNLPGFRTVRRNSSHSNTSSTSFDTNLFSFRDDFSGHVEQELAVVSSATPAQETRWGGREALPEELLVQNGLPFQTRQDWRRESRRPLGVVPWVTFFSASIVMGVVYLGCVMWYMTDLVLDVQQEPEIPEEDFTTPLLGLAAPELEGAHLMFGPGHWPQRPVPLRPIGLACHDSLGPRAFLVERFTVHEVQLDAPTGAWMGGSSGANASKTLPTHQAFALNACLAKVPGFHGDGLAGMSLTCGAAGHCQALLLSASGDKALQCPLTRKVSSGPSGWATSTPMPTTVTLGRSGGITGWSSLASSWPDEDGGPHRWWGQPLDGSETSGPARLRVRAGKGRHLDVLPERPERHTPKPLPSWREEAPQPAALRTTGQQAARDSTLASPQVALGAEGLQTYGDGLIGLSANGRLLGWSTHPGPEGWEEGVAAGRGMEGKLLEVGSWQLPTGRSWAGVCASGRQLFATATTAGGGPELWRFDLPQQLSDLQTG